MMLIYLYQTYYITVKENVKKLFVGTKIYNYRIPENHLKGILTD